MKHTTMTLTVSAAEVPESGVASTLTPLMIDLGPDRIREMLDGEGEFRELLEGMSSDDLTRVAMKVMDWDAVHAAVLGAVRRFMRKAGDVPPEYRLATGVAERDRLTAVIGHAASSRQKAQEAINRAIIDMGLGKGEHIITTNRGKVLVTVHEDPPVVKRPANMAVVMSEVGAMVAGAGGPVGPVIGIEQPDGSVVEMAVN